MKAKRKHLRNSILAGAAAVVLMFTITAAGGGFPIKLNPFIKDLKTKLTQYNDQKPEDRVYLHFDKPFYKPGEDIWFSAYLRDAGSMARSKKSDILHVELINPKGNVQQRMKLIAKNGVAKGDFHLDTELAGGLYKVKAFTKFQDNEKEAFIFEKEFQVQKVVLPNLKMKLDFERKAYGPGDKVIATLDLQTNDNQPLANHNFNYLASLDGGKLVELQGKTDGKGKARLRFGLPDGLETTDGLVNVMIDFDGLTESISRSIPIVLNKIEIEFFPEGGDLVYGLQSKVAFRALNEFGKPADIQGVVVDDQGAEVATFNSYHQGMGAFSFNPGENRSYTAKITQPEGIARTYEMPEPMARGFVMNVGENDSKELSVAIRSTESEAMSLVAQVRGQVYWASEVNVIRGNTDVRIALDKFPMGVTQLTLFDAKGIQRCERLAFVNRDRQLKIDIKTDKKEYMPREKVKMTVRVTDERGLPMPAALSLSVVNDQLISFADDKSGNILSKLLLEPDLKQKVEEAKFYFDKKEEKAVLAMDYLMLTSGWRRFVWEEVLQANQFAALKHPGERAVISGIVTNSYDGRAVPHAKLKVGEANVVLADKDGFFTIDDIDLSKDNVITATAANFGQQAQTFHDFNQNARFYLYPQQAMNRPMGGARDLFMDEVEEVPAMADDFDMGAGGIAVPDMARRDAPMKRERVQRAPAMAGAKKGKTKAAEFKAFAPAKDANVALAEVEMLIEEKEMVMDREMDGIEPRDQKNNDKHRDREKADDLLADGKNEAPMMAKVATGTVADARFNQIRKNDNAALQAGQQPARYYRAREFAAPVYTSTEGSAPAKRTDFRSTLYWNPTVNVDRSGKAVLEFYCSDEISSFRAIAEGISQAGEVGHAEQLFYTQLPFSMQARVPTEVATNDILVVPVVLKNNTSIPMIGTLHVMPPSGLQPMGSTGSSLTIAAGQVMTVNLKYKVLKACEEVFDIAFASTGHTDAFQQKLKIVPQGFPAVLSFAGKTEEKHNFKIGQVVPGSISASFTAFPNVVSDLVKGIESILREPYGCFEQTSTSSYPNAMVMSYMQEQENPDAQILKRAEDLLKKGYKRLTTFETKQKGYEWFGSAPGHEALTAYGLMQFSDYSKVMDGVDKGMVERTAKWLLDRRDGKGGFQRNARALDQFGRASAAVTNAYIIYALSEAGFDEIKPEALVAFDKAMSSKDPYQLGLVANAMYNLGINDKGQKAIDALLKIQAGDGSWAGNEGSITKSGGISLKVETTSLVVMGLLKSGSPSFNELEKGVKFIVGARSGHGGFGSTQGTILGLKALVSFAKFGSKTSEDGLVEIFVDGNKVAEQAYEAGQREPIEVKGLEAYLSEGVHSIEVKYPGVKNTLPYSIAVEYHTNRPASSKDCVLRLTTDLSATKVKMGETVRLSAKLVNETESGQPMTMAILGLPAGLSAQPWQLKELQEKKVFDFYEVIGNNIVCYYRQMEPGQVRQINLDLKADIPGSYSAPASSAYLYYTAEHKNWTALPQVEVVN